MKKTVIFALLIAAATAVQAIPAKRGWRTVTQSDGTTLEVMALGDEFYHYMINRDGKEVVRTSEGKYMVAGEAPSHELAQARRMQGKIRRLNQISGVEPNLAPRGVVILANFKDLKMKTAHTKAVFEELCSSENCTVNSGYPSAREYFKSQSNGAYAPQFDVFGPVTLSSNYSYYGKNDSYGSDSYATDAVIEACILANNQYSDLDFTNYDSDNDGYVDFVYVIYAGYGESETWSFNTNYIWPHNSTIQYIVQGYNYGWTKYQKKDTKLDDKYLDNYAMSNEIEYYNNDALTGIGTLCHEFGHVIGLPDFYDTNSNSGGTVNSTNMLTPSDWDVMDYGAYNKDGHCPCNYSPWEKYFFGWHTPLNLGNNGQLLELKANGTDGYQAYQLNTSNKQQSATTAGECYYIENRQQVGWDEGLLGHGLLIWKVNFDASAWEKNTPNNTNNNPKYTIVSASGTKIGSTYDSNGNTVTYCDKNTYPGSGNVTNKTIANKPLKSITESNNIISLVYIEAPANYTVTWKVNGVVIETKQYNLDGSEILVLPTAAVTPCDGTEFIGWTTESEWLDPFNDPEDLFTTASGKVTENVTYYAVFK